MLLKEKERKKKKNEKKFVNIGKEKTKKNNFYNTP